MNLSKNLKKIKGFVTLGLVINVFHTLYVYARAGYLNAEIPLWYTLPWGEKQLAAGTYIFLLPLLAWLIFFAGIVFVILAFKYHLRFGKEIITSSVIFALCVLAYSSVRIIFIASVPFEPFINPNVLNMAILLGLGFIVAYVIAPKVISYMFDNGIVTDPNIHKHPGMILVKPSARGGGIIFASAFIILSLIFIPLSKPVLALLIAAGFTAILGYLDDIQNTHMRTRLKGLENPIVRLGFQTVIALFVVLMGFRIDFINNPFDGIIFFNSISFELLGMTVYPLAVIISTLWLVWMMNMLSWSNAIDGQYSGIIGIASLSLVFLTMRPGLESPLLPKEVIAGLALLMAGASFGILPFNWHPSKIMWGFGAISAGLVFASLAIATQAKISASIIVILIPFMDGLITITRRIVQGKFPLKADKQHLHHLLLARGWGVKRIAVFYWISTALLGVISIISADKDLPLLILSVVGGVGLLIGLINLQAKRSRLKQQQLE